MLVSPPSPRLPHLSSSPPRQPNTHTQGLAPLSSHPLPPPVFSHRCDATTLPTLPTHGVCLQRCLCTVGSDSGRAVKAGQLSSLCPVAGAVKAGQLSSLCPVEGRSKQDNYHRFVQWPGRSKQDNCHCFVQWRGGQSSTTIIALSSGGAVKAGQLSSLCQPYISASVVCAAAAAATAADRIIYTHRFLQGQLASETQQALMIIDRWCASAEDRAGMLQVTR